MRNDIVEKQIRDFMIGFSLSYLTCTILGFVIKKACNNSKNN